MITREELVKEQEKIAQFIEYSVGEEDRAQALFFLEKHNDNPVILTLLKEFYSNLPEGLEEPVTGIGNIRCRQGAYLLAVSTTDRQYLYYVDSKRAMYLCPLGQMIDQNDILEYFDYQNGEELVRECREAVEEEVSFSLDEPISSGCPACFVEHGELHEFGCLVEVCPWCDGQLVKCNCRFDHLGLDEIVDEEQLLSFFELLSEKGRIPYKKKDSVSYPSDSRGIVDE